LRARIDDTTRELDDGDWAKFDKDRRLLFCAIEAWKQRQQVHMPNIQERVLGRVTDNQASHPEHLSLHLPSDFTPDERRNFGLAKIARVELSLRKGEANDALRELRKQINFKLGLIDGKKRHAKYTNDMTRAAKIVRDANRARDAAASMYRDARKAIVSLGGDGEKEFPLLKDQDMYAKQMSNGSDLGGGKTIEGWIFSDGPRLTKDEKELEEWEVEGELSRIQSVPRAVDAENFVS
jgi:hypothetical protein